MRHAVRIVLACAALALTVTACGQPADSGRSGGPAAGQGEDAAFDEGMLKWARCMRENGVDIPDPRPNEPVRIPAVGPESERAARACEKFEPTVPGAADPEAMHQRQVAISRCLREHGIDVPDPKPGQGMPVPEGGEKVLQALRECSAKVPQ